jgi:hypothetical protein
MTKGGKAVTIAMPTGLGAIIAILVIVFAIIFLVLGQFSLLIAGILIAALAVARLT